MMSLPVWLHGRMLRLGVFVPDPMFLPGDPCLGGGSLSRGVSVSIPVGCFLFIKTSTDVFIIFSVSIFALIAVKFLKGQVKKNITV